MKLVAPNAGRNRVMEYLRLLIDEELTRLPDHPTAAQMEKLLRYDDFHAIKDAKKLQTIADGPSDLIVPGPKALRAHHIIPEYVQTKLSALGVDVGNMNKTPVKVFTDEAHFGAGQDSLHKKMNAWGEGALSPAKVAQSADKTELIDNLITFYKQSNHEDMAKVVRGWARQRSIPYTL